MNLHCKILLDCVNILNIQSIQNIHSQLWQCLFCKSYYTFYVFDSLTLPRSFFIKVLDFLSYNVILL